MENKITRDWFRYFAPRFLALSVVVGLLTRIILICLPITTVNFSAGEWLRIFGLGVLNDVAFAIIALSLGFLVYSLATVLKYNRPACYILLGFLVLLAVYSFLPNSLFAQYGSAVPNIAKGVSILLLVSFSIKLFLPSVRDSWRAVVLSLVMFLYVMFLVFNVIGEITFWTEFGVRYNFIAVDYLVYTHEVIGNIVESYPILPLVLLILAVSMAVYWLIFRRTSPVTLGVKGWKVYLVNLVVLAAGFSASAAWLHHSYLYLGVKNAFVTQLQSNGCWNFLEAFYSNELSYEQFYSMLPEEKCSSLQKELCGMDASGVKEVRDSLAPVRKNIVLVTIESLSASFLGDYGDTNGLTPNLDSLMDSSLVFDRLFATGNRTVRGLEALTLCIPPSAGESIVKRPSNSGLFTIGNILRDNGYTTRFIYGGDSYFDNMGVYYSGNGFAVTDKKDYDKERIVFSNIWGTCDEDSYREALEIFDRDHASGNPFFAQIMTISNHRPYTYPEGRISFDGNPKSRAAAVKYTDYAIGSFIREAKSHPWFHDTIFIIVADHCASSAGKTSLPLDKYHIPAMVYSPGFIQPRRVGKICSQIDLMPTVFSLLHFSYDSRFYGGDILSDSFVERAFMATYQDLGYYRDGKLTVLSPVRMERQWEEVENADWTYTEIPVEEPSRSLVEEAVAYYQSVN